MHQVKVRVVRRIREHLLWVASMDKYVGDGKDYEASRWSGESAFVETDGPNDGWYFPAAALEPVPETYGNEEN